MARIRTIKPSFWGSPDVVRLRIEARLLVVGLISMADDDGRFPASVAAIHGYVFPHDDLPRAKIARWMTEIAETGLVHQYEVGGLTYGCFPTWHRHQSINKYTPSGLPEPDVACDQRKQ